MTKPFSLLRTRTERSCRVTHCSSIISPPPITKKRRYNLVPGESRKFRASVSIGVRRTRKFFSRQMTRFRSGCCCCCCCCCWWRTPFHRYPTHRPVYQAPRPSSGDTQRPNLQKFELIHSFNTNSFKNLINSFNFNFIKFCVKCVFEVKYSAVQHSQKIPKKFSKNSQKYPKIKKFNK